MGYKQWKWPIILKILNFIGAGTSIFIGVWGYLRLKPSFKSVLINLYIIMFSFFLILAELRITRFTNKFRFLQSHFGRSMCVLFIGSMDLAFGIAPNIVVGAYMFAIALLHFFLLCCARPDFLEQERAAAKASLEAVKADARSTVRSGVQQGVKDAAKETVSEKTPAWARKSSEPTPVASPASSSTTPAWARGNNDQAESIPVATPLHNDTNDDDTPAWARGNADRSSGVRVDDNPFK